jgi:hypothetical protein
VKIHIPNGDLYEALYRHGPLAWDVLRERYPEEAVMREFLKLERRAVIRRGPSGKLRDALLVGVERIDIGLDLPAWLHRSTMGL